jgi:hypothetical protein
MTAFKLRRGRLFVAGITAAAVSAAVTVGSGPLLHAGAATDPFANRGDIVHLPAPLKSRLIALSQQPVAYQPQTAFNEAAGASQLFQYYLLDQKNFQPNVFTTASPTALGGVRIVVEPKPGLPTDPNNVKAAVDAFTDIVGLPVINNEAGFYEGWYLHDLQVPRVVAPHDDGRAQFGTITNADAKQLADMGSGNNVPGHVFTVDGKAPNFGSASDVFPDGKQPNTVVIPVSAGTFNALQQGESHAYWEFNTGTDWSPPTYELPFTGGIKGTLAQQYKVQSLIPGSGPEGIHNSALTHGDNPNNPRDPDNNAETRNRFIPSGLANEIMLDVYARVKSFEPQVTSLQERIFDAYAKEVARVDGADHDGAISFAEADVNGISDGQSNVRLYLPATAFNRFSVTRELDNGLLNQRFAPSQRAFVLSGNLVGVNPAVPASIPGAG